MQLVYRKGKIVRVNGWQSGEYPFQTVQGTNLWSLLRYHDIYLDMIIGERWYFDMRLRERRHGRPMPYYQPLRGDERKLYRLATGQIMADRTPPEGLFVDDPEEVAYSRWMRRLDAGEACVREVNA